MIWFSWSSYHISQSYSKSFLKCHLGKVRSLWYGFDFIAHCAFWPTQNFRLTATRDSWSKFQPRFNMLDLVAQAHEKVKNKTRHSAVPSINLSLRARTMIWHLDRLWEGSPEDIDLLTTTGRTVGANCRLLLRPGHREFLSWAKYLHCRRGHSRKQALPSHRRIR